MNKKTIFALLILFLFLVSGCIHHQKSAYRQSMEGWEFVRIERQVPTQDCIYKLQEVCGERSTANCYVWFKRRAKHFGANVVVLTEDVRDRTIVAGSPSPAAPLFKSSMTSTLLADYYDCPKCEPN